MVTGSVPTYWQNSIFAVGSMVFSKCNVCLKIITLVQRKKNSYQEEVVLLVYIWGMGAPNGTNLKNPGLEPGCT